MYNYRLPYQVVRYSFRLKQPQQPTKNVQEDTTMRTLIMFLSALLMTTTGLFSGTITDPVRIIWDESSSSWVQTGENPSTFEGFNTWRYGAERMIYTLSQNGNTTTTLSNGNWNFNVGSGNGSSLMYPDFGSGMYNSEFWTLDAWYEKGLTKETIADPGSLETDPAMYQWETWRTVANHILTTSSYVWECIAETCTQKTWWWIFITTQERSETNWLSSNKDGRSGGSYFNFNESQNDSNGYDEYSYNRYGGGSDVPEPSTMAFTGLGLGLMCLAFVRR